MRLTAPGASSPERTMVLEMARLGLVVGPVFVVASTVFWGWNGLWSSLFASVLVIANLMLGATIIERTVAISANALMGAVLGGFIARLVLLALVVLPVRHSSWFASVPFAISLVGGHLALLTLEAKRVSTTLASPKSASAGETPIMSAGSRSESE